MFELAVDRLMGKLPRVEYLIGTYHTFEAEIAEQFAQATGLETVYQVAGESFAKADDAQAALRAATLKAAGRMMQVQEVSQKLDDGSELIQYHIAGQLLQDEELANKLAEKVQAAMAGTPAAKTPEEVAQQARKMFAAGIKALEELQGE